ncbi:MAG: tetratricopeptide repeat protein [Saprospiraceae bacterium]|nr:tetratricopeptide repeat protein [Saprospiraceae bacterium]
MKTIRNIFFVTFYFWVSHSQAQVLSNRIASQACKSLESITDFQTLEDSLDSNIASAMAEIMSTASNEERGLLSTIDGMKSTLLEALILVTNNCSHVRNLLIEKRRSIYYRNSDNVEAQMYYEEGTRYLQDGDYPNAILNYRRAIKQDRKFVYAIDNLAVAYRKQEVLKRALKQYNRSLEIFPEGSVALTNAAVIHSFNEDYDNAADLYTKLKFYYPENPEGYFGLGKIFYLMKVYDKALDNIFFAHRKYLEIDSDYVEDSQKLIDIVVSDLRRMNMIELVEQKAKEHNIKMELK